MISSIRNEYPVPDVSSSLVILYRCAHFQSVPLPLQSPCLHPAHLEKSLLGGSKTFHSKYHTYINLLKTPLCTWYFPWLETKWHVTASRMKFKPHSQAFQAPCTLVPAYLLSCLSQLPLPTPATPAPQPSQHARLILASMHFHHSHLLLFSRMLPCSPPPSNYLQHSHVFQVQLESSIFWCCPCNHSIF